MGFGVEDCSGTARLGEGHGRRDSPSERGAGEEKEAHRLLQFPSPPPEGDTSSPSEEIRPSDSSQDLKQRHEAQVDTHGFHCTNKC